MFFIKRTIKVYYIFKFAERIKYIFRVNYVPVGWVSRRSGSRCGWRRPPAGGRGGEAPGGGGRSPGVGRGSIYQRREMSRSRPIASSPRYFFPFISREIIQGRVNWGIFDILTNATWKKGLIRRNVPGEFLRKLNPRTTTVASDVHLKSAGRIGTRSKKSVDPPRDPARTASFLRSDPGAGPPDRKISDRIRSFRPGDPVFLKQDRNPSRTTRKVNAGLIYNVLRARDFLKWHHVNGHDFLKLTR